MKNALVARILNRVADFLELKEETFRAKAYRRAAHTIQLLPTDIEEYAKKRKLTELPGIGKNIAEKIEEILETGQLSYLEELEKEYTIDMDSLLAIEGIGPRTIKILYEKLKIKNLQDLEYHAQKGNLQKIKGIGEKKEKRILQSIKFVRSTLGRRLLAYAAPIAEYIKSRIEEHPKTEKVKIAGSIRRGKETIGDIDILTTTKNPKEIIDYFTSLEIADEIIAKGPKKAIIRLEDGLECELRIFKEDEFGAALLYFTGSMEFNVELRRLARSKSMKLNEYGLYKNSKRIASKTEKEIFKALGLEYIQPELRENNGEIEAALQGKLPTLVREDQIKGDLHIHSIWSDGTETIETLAKAAESLGYEYIAITDHSSSLKIVGGLDEEKLQRQIEEIDKLNSKVHVFKGIEVNIRLDGQLDIPDDILSRLDIVIASIHSPGREDMTERILSAIQNKHVHIIGHPTGRKLFRREEYPLNLDRIFEEAADNGKIFEMNANPIRLDLKDIYIKKAIEYGCKLAINSDAHRLPDLHNIKWGVKTARRGWATSEDIINTMNLKQIKKILKNNSSGVRAS
ncbi:MAG: DNA polymerase/3'-5' exonuclease PolX [Methanobacteriales archaeon]|nr:DNA polymerase/3'-5' exonuclease PolX [Methanobacteriales archaeon]